MLYPTLGVRAIFKQGIIIFLISYSNDIFPTWLYFSIFQGIQGIMLQNTFKIKILF